jgi:hypothetical protein
MANLKKLAVIFSGIIQLKTDPGWAYSTTVPKSIIPTASLVMPSPKMTLKSLGYYSYFTMETAATTSELQSREHIRRISISLSWNASLPLS